MRVVVASVVVLFSAFFLPARAAPPACPSTEKLGEDVIASTVTVLADGKDGIMGSGSGFFVANDIVVTNWHVVDGSTKLRIKLTTSEETFPVEGIIGADLANDLAVLKIAAPVTGKALGLFPELPKRGAKVYAFGSPRLLEATMSDGIVSAEREIEGAQRIQITAAVSPGSSGGPVTDDCGRVIGVAYMKVRDAEALNFAIPAHFVVTALKGVTEARSAEYWKQTGQAELKKVTASRLGVPEGVDPEQWVQVDAVAQRFLIGLERRPLDGVEFFKHVGRKDLVTEADNTIPTVLYGTAGACGALSACGCLASIPLIYLGVGFITGPIFGAGLCASAGLGGAGYMMWQDGVVPELPFKEREAMVRLHNEGLLKKPAKKAGPQPAPEPNAPIVGDDDPADRTTTAPVGDPPPPLSTPTPSLERPANTPKSMRF